MGIKLPQLLKELRSPLTGTGQAGQGRGEVEQRRAWASLSRGGADPTRMYNLSGGGWPMGRAARPPTRRGDGGIWGEDPGVGLGLGLVNPT